MTMTILRSYRLGGALARKGKVERVREAHGIAKAKTSPLFLVHPPRALLIVGAADF